MVKITINLYLVLIILLLFNSRTEENIHISENPLVSNFCRWWCFQKVC